MKASELRIGNFVHLKGYPAVEFPLSERRALMVLTKGYGVEPIPLTEDWLVRFGFEKKTELNYERDLVRKLVYKSERAVNDKIKIFDFKTGEFSAWNSGYLNTIKHVHQLQNLYFALTGNELLINA